MTSCEYCKLLHGVLVRARTHQEMRRAKARIRLHIQQVHKNPPPRRKIKALKLATKLAYRIYKHVKDNGYAIPLPARTPPLVRKYVKFILEANGIKLAEKNPPKITMKHLKDIIQKSSKARSEGNIRKFMMLHDEFKKAKRAYYRQKRKS